LSLYRASLTGLPLPEESLDGAITINTLYFIAELDRALSELARALNASGHAVIGLADPEWMSKLPTADYGFVIRPLPEVKNAAANAGLIVHEDRRVGQDAYPYHLLVVGPAATVS
jgi:arsenite methyltransferase